MSNEEIEVRRATRGDVPAICGLLYEGDRFHQLFDTVQIRQGEPQQADSSEIEAGLGDEATHVFVAAQNSTVVGYIRIVIYQSKGNRLFVPLKFAHVFELLVANNVRRQGIGSMLLDAARDVAKAHDATRLSLEHYAANTAAAEFYARHGFVVMRQTQTQDLT